MAAEMERWAMAVATYWVVVVMAVAVEMEYRSLEDMALVGGVAMAVAVCLTTWPYQTWPYRTAMAANGSSHRSGSAWSGQRAPQDTETSAGQDEGWLG